MRANRLISNKNLFLFLLTALIVSSVNAQTLTKNQKSSLYLLNLLQEQILLILMPSVKPLMNLSQQ
jgi:hypothetical protein